jgi:pantoate--beta-alanine ligase
VRVVHTFDEVRSVSTGRTALVPTMGSLHAGHASLVRIAAERAERVVMSVFVNPLQFDDPGDLERYPRDLAGDAAVASEAGVDVLFAPPTEEMYPDPPRTHVSVDGASSAMEGAHRPGHFAGVATVVAKLFAGIGPAVAVFGRKDAQQVAVVRRMTFDLSFPIEIVAAPTVREHDGLAMSSRNVFLSADDRHSALSISSGLFDAAAAVEAGERSAAALEEIVRRHLAGAGIEPEYVTLADAVDAVPVDVLERESFLALAARVGPVRLIDNVFLWPDGSTDTGVIQQSEPGRS